MKLQLFGKTMTAIEKSMDLRLRRHAVLSSNVANAETPNYKARELDFAGELSKSLGTDNSQVQKTHARHMDITSPDGSHIVFDDSMPVSDDGNNVDLDRAMGKISANARSFSAATNYLNMRLRVIRFASRGGRGM